MLMVAASALALTLLAAGTVGLASAEPAASPYQQMRDGTPLESIACGDGKLLLQKNGRPACVIPATAERLEARGWEVVRAAEPAGTAEPQPSAILPAGTAAPQPDADPPADGGDAVVYDPLYIIDDKIYLGGVEKRLPNPTGVWLPVTREAAEQEVMPRLAGGIGDELILPYTRVVEYGSNNVPLYTYETERGNRFKAYGVNGYPDVITKIHYFVYGHKAIDVTKRLGYEAEAALLDERGGFLRSLMENAGFNVSKVTGGDNSAVVYNGYGPPMHVYQCGLANCLQLKFNGWASDVPPDGYILPKPELKNRINDFVARHTDVFNERCIFTQKDADVHGIMVVAGVPLYAASVGHCIDVKYPGFGPDTQSVLIEATEGEIIWFSYRPYVVGDWLDRLDIPESAKVMHGG